jgi:hypothetical protein
MRRESANQDQVVLIKHREGTTWHDMTLSQKVVDFTARHQFSAITGCWALGIAGAFGAIMRNPCVENHKLPKREKKLTRMLHDHTAAAGIKVCRKRYV